MKKAAIAVAAFLLLGALAGAAVFLWGMRTKSPQVQGAVRRFNRDVVNPQQLQTAGRPGAEFSIVRHVGRTSGKEYTNPVGAVATDEGFVIALPYGTDADWVQNVRAAGGGTIVHEGSSYLVDRPEVVALDGVAEHFASELRLLSALRVEQALLLRRAEVADEPGAQGSL